jgi:mannose/fructose/N-acetylgalactosamine-specific phosphotransferase system component IIC
MMLFKAISPDDKRWAVIAQSFYLANLTVLPVIGFLMLVFFYFKHDKNFSAFNRQHFLAAIIAGFCAGALLVIGPLAALLFFHFSDIALLSVVVYAVIMHGMLVLTGIIFLAKSLANKPLITPPAN